MARMNPLGKIKDVAVGSVKLPVTAAGSAVGLAKGATGKVAGTVTSLVGGRTGGTSAPASAEQSSTSRPEPVNVTEELGLDPAPVEKPEPTRKTAGSKPTTKIDAAADPSKVDVTPADVAEAVSRDASAGRKPAE